MTEVISSARATIAYVIRANVIEAYETTFFTSPEELLQVGVIVYPAGGEVVRHSHRPIERRSTGTPEVLFVQAGRCEVDLYDYEHRLVQTVELRAGDVIIMVSGGHGFRMLEETRLLEVKPGPYAGIGEKDRF